MITITKDGNNITCSKNTFETIYKRMGYELVIPSKPTAKVEKPIEKVVKKVEEKVEEIPVVEMKSEKKVVSKKDNKNVTKKK